MKTKKLVSLIMAGAMALALAAPAFATATVDYTEEYTRTFEATVSDVSIDVTVPIADNHKLVLNPYKKSYTDTTITTASTEQVIFPELTIASTTAAPVAVSAKIKATVGSDVKLATTSVAAADAKKPVADKQLFLFLAFKAESFGDTAVTYDSKATSQQLFTAKETSKDAMITIGAGTTASPSSVYYKVCGDCASQPVSAWDGENDTVELSIAFAFVLTPVPAS